jgi:hypothetical protein
MSADAEQSAAPFVPDDGFQVESTLTRKIASALTPRVKMIRPVVETGIEPVGELLHGALPVGAIGELTGRSAPGERIAPESVVKKDQVALCSYSPALREAQPPESLPVRRMGFETEVQQFEPELLVIGGLRWPHCSRMEISAVQMQRDGDGG